MQKTYTYILCVPSVCRTVCGITTDFPKQLLSTMLSTLQYNQQVLRKMFWIFYRNQQVIDI